MSVDPLWGKYGDVSPYHYGFNNPINLLDASGLDSAGWASAETLVDIVAGGAAVAGGLASIGFGIALCAAPTGITQVAGVGLIGLGIGAVGFGGAKTVDAIAALVHDTPKHDIPSSYGDLAGTATDKALGGDGQVGGIVGSLGEGLVGVGLIKVGAKAAPPLIKSLGPLFVSAVDDATIGVNMMSTTATILDKSNLIDKKATDAQPSKQKDKEALGGSGGLPAPQGRNEY